MDFVKHPASSDACLLSWFVARQSIGFAERVALVIGEDREAVMSGWGICVGTSFIRSD